MSTKHTFSYVIRQKKNEKYFLESNSFKKVQVNCATSIDELFP